MFAEWEIKPRGRKCARTSQQFRDGEPIYTLLFRQGGGFRREDISEAAWATRPAELVPFSFWRSAYKEPDPPAPETLPKETGENLLRRLLREDRPEDANTRYILALMLERKKVLRQVDARALESGRLLVYEHAKTGEVFLIADPQLQLSELEKIQSEIYARLAAG